MGMIQLNMSDEDRQILDGSNTRIRGCNGKWKRCI